MRLLFSSPLQSREYHLLPISRIFASLLGRNWKTLFPSVTFMMPAQDPGGGGRPTAQPREEETERPRGTTPVCAE